MATVLRSIVIVGWLTISLTVPGRLARADAILDWNEIAIESVVAAKQIPPMTTRSMAMVHAAMFDAVDAIDPRFTAYRVKVTAEPGASAEAAAAASAHLVLVKLLPDQKDRLNSVYAPWVARATGDSHIRAGCKLGETVAAEMIAWRAKDGIGAPNKYRPQTAPGIYVPTTLPAAFDFAKSTPWLMERGDQFRPAPPPPLTSARWTRDYNEIKAFGSKDSATRTAEQTVVARFWLQAGAASWNPILRQFVQSKNMSEVEEARLFALAYLATADTLVAVFDAKYAYGFWRPITAIRNGDRDGNDATAPGVTRRWTRLSAYVDEVSNARVWAGFHYRFSTEVAEEMGRKIAELAEKRFLTRKVLSSKN